jgi:regulatory protein RepA
MNAPTVDFDPETFEPLVPVANLAPARQLLTAGLKLCALKPNSKAPVGLGWNEPANCIQAITDDLTGVGFPLAINKRCSIDPDEVEIARLVMKAWGFSLDDIMDAGVRTNSTRPGSGGRSQFEASPDLGWVTFRTKVAGENVTVLELRAASANLQDVVPGLRYADKSGEIRTQSYANGRTFLEAPALPADFRTFWAKMTSDMVFRGQMEDAANAALRDAGYVIDVIRDLSGTGAGNLPFSEISKRLRAQFNDAVSVESILGRHGYKEHRRGRWEAPNATGEPGIRCIKGHESLWQSDHGSDPLRGTFDAAAASIVLDFAYDTDAFEQWVRDHLQGLKVEQAKVEFAAELGQTAVDVPYWAIPVDVVPVAADPEQVKWDAAAASAAAMFSRINLAPLTREELKSAKLTPRVILENLLYADVRVRVAAGGVGKTTLALHEAVRLALGLELWGRVPDGPKKTMIFTREDQRAILAARLREIMRVMMLSEEQEDQVLQNVRIIDLSGAAIRLSVIADDVVMPNRVVLNWIIDIAKPWRPDWMIFDPLVSFGVGESRVNDAEQGLVEAFRVLRNELDCCTEGIHHTGKANARDKTSDQYSSRGGTALPDGSRMVAVLNPATPEEWLKETSTPLAEGEDGIVMALPKLSYCAKQEAVFIRRKGYSFSMAARVTLSPEDLRRADADKLLNFIAKEYSEGRRYSSKDLEASMVTIGLSRAKIRASVTHLKMTGRVKYNEVQGKEGSHYEPIFISVEDFDSGDENGDTRRHPQFNDIGVENEG